MDERELQAQLSALLAEELGERIPDLNRLLLAIDRERSNDALVRELHRLIHVVKGASRSAGLVAVEAQCHELETLLGTVEPSSAVSTEIIEAGMHFADELERARDRLLGGVPAEPEPSAATSKAAPHASSPEKLETSVRVAADDLDLMMGHSADVIVARQRLAIPLGIMNELRTKLDRASTGSVSQVELGSIARTLTRVHRELVTNARALDTASMLLDGQVRRLRLRSIADACQGCERIVHDVAASLGKTAELTVRGAEVHIDRAQIDLLREVLVQLVRNAVAHGIEKPAQRRAAGKPERGQVVIDASVGGDMIRVAVSDDGAGLDLRAIGEQSARHGLRVETAADAHRAIFAAGVSTATTITEAAGRGIGLDIAKQRIEALHGSIRVESVPGANTTFSIELPTTVATIHAVVVESGTVSYAVPSGNVERLIRIDEDDIRHVDSRSLVRVGDDWIAVGSLSRILGVTTDLVPTARITALVISHGSHRVAIIVDRVIGNSDLAMGALTARVGRLRHLTGQTILGDGSIALVLNAADLVDDVLGTALPAAAPKQAPERVKRVLLVDDSATTRALELNILRSAGYDVIVAVDGEDALRQLGTHTVDLIVSDVDMPNLDGFGLTQAVRESPRLSAVPVVLVTARGTDADRAKGLRVGASAYLVKSSFDQTVLLQTIERLL